MYSHQERRIFFKHLGILTPGSGFSPLLLQSCGAAGSGKTAMESSDLFFKISLAQWSLH